MEDQGKLEGPPKKREERLKLERERQEKIKQSRFKVIEGGKDSQQSAESPASFKFPDEFFKKPFNPKEPGILDEGE